MVASSILYPLENLAEMHPGYIDSVQYLNFKLVIQTNAQSMYSQVPIKQVGWVFQAVYKSHKKVGPIKRIEWNIC